MKQKSRQAEFGFVNWGGKRRGAGRKPRGKVAGVSHGKRGRISRHHPVQVTIRLVAGLPSLRYFDTLDLIRQLCSEYPKEGVAMRVVEYSVQSNHLHLIVEVESEAELASGMNSFNACLARRLNRLWRRSGRVLADRYHHRVLRTPREVRSALVYVLQNGRKHGAWSARCPDVFSSGRWFEGWRDWGAESGRPLARARTWLLNLGWRRRGRIGLLELPAGAQPVSASASA